MHKILLALLISITASCTISDAFGSGDEIVESYPECLADERSFMMEIMNDLGATDIDMMETGDILFDFNGHSAALFRLPDGDLQLFHGIKMRCPLEMVNEWNKLHRHSRVYLDDENDPVLESDLLSDGGNTHEKLRMFIQVFLLSLDDFHQHLYNHHCWPV